MLVRQKLIVIATIAIGTTLAYRGTCRPLLAASSEETPWGATGPAWSPDGARLAFSLFGSIWQAPAPAELADKNCNRCCGRSSMNLQPYDLLGVNSNRKRAFLAGDSVPKPLGFTAFPPEWLLLGRLAPPRHSGHWVGARVASLRCLILRPGEVSLNRAPRQTKTQRKLLQKLVSVR